MSPSLIRHIAIGGGYLAAWLLLDYLGFLFEVSPGVSPWYLAHGLSLALLAVFGPRYLPLLAVGPLINGALFWLPGEWPVLIPLSLALMATYGLGGFYLHLKALDPGLRSLRDAGLFLGVGFLASAAAGPLAVGTLVAGGVLPAADYLPVAATFWAGDTLGVFGAGALFLVVMAWLRERLAGAPARVPAAPAAAPFAGAERHPVHLALQAAVFAGFVALASHRWGLFNDPPLYLLALPVLWLAFLHGSRGAVLAVAAANACPLLVMALESTAATNLAGLQLQLAVVSIAGVALGAAVSEARRRRDELVQARAEAEVASRMEAINAALRERMKELRCLYRVLELTTEDSRAVDEICAEIARTLPPSLLHDADAVARVQLGEREFKSADWSEPLAALRRPIASAERSFGLIEVGYRSPHESQAGGEGPFIKEELDLVVGVATHIARMIKSRRTAEHLARAERASAIGQLTGGVAHDFNNLLTIILGNADLLARDLARDGQLRRHAELIRAAADRGAELTGRLLAFARQQPLQPAAVDVEALIADMQGLLRSSIGEHIEIEVRGGQDVAPATVDRVQLEAALLNVCLNARDAMPGGGRIVIDTADVELEESALAPDDEVVPGPYVMISVSDEGSGIAPETLPRVFEPFFTTKDVGEGSGLGLSMVQGFARQSGGHVAIRSTLGEGTTVELYLPRASREAEREPVEDAPAAAAPSGAEKILLVEDDALVRDYATAQIAALGYDVVAASDGREALRRLEADCGFDLLFTDVVMPGGLDGKQLAERARAMQPGLKVLFTSGYAENSIARNGRLDPGVALLGKPYRPAELARRLREVLEAEAGV